MVTTTEQRTAHLLELMTKGDDLFNARDWQALEAVHHPDMIAHVTGSAEPIYGREAHAAAMQQLVRMFPDIRVHTPYPIQFGSGDWITVVTNVTGTFTVGMTLPDGTVIPPQERRSTSSSPRPASGTETGSSSFPPSGTPCSRPSSWAPRSNKGVVRLGFPSGAGVPTADLARGGLYGDG